MQATASCLGRLCASNTGSLSPALCKGHPCILQVPRKVGGMRARERKRANCEESGHCHRGGHRFGGEESDHHGPVTKGLTVLLGVQKSWGVSDPSYFSISSSEKSSLHVPAREWLGNAQGKGWL